jgi:DNA-binding NarL/FixJ family response regulator
MNNSIRIILADDHPLVRTGIGATIKAEPDMQLVGEAADGHETRRVCGEVEADILLLDLSMPGPPVIETVSYLRENCPDLKIVVLTAYDDDAYVHTLLSSGVEGYILKEEAPTAIVQAIRAIYGGAAWFSGGILEKLVQGQSKRGGTDILTSLTDRDRDLLEAISQGWDNNRIARELHLAEQTVRNYTSRLYDRIGVTTRAEAIVWARNRGFGRNPH